MTTHALLLLWVRETEVPHVILLQNPFASEHPLCTLFHTHLLSLLFLGGFKQWLSHVLCDLDGRDQSL